MTTKELQKAIQVFEKLDHTEEQCNIFKEQRPMFHKAYIEAYETSISTCRFPITFDYEVTLFCMLEFMVFAELQKMEVFWSLKMPKVEDDKKTGTKRLQLFLPNDVSCLDIFNFTPVQFYLYPKGMKLKDEDKVRYMKLKATPAQLLLLSPSSSSSSEGEK